MGKKKRLAGTEHKKAPLSVAVVLERRNVIGFARVAVQERYVIDGLPVRHTTDYDA